MIKPNKIYLPLSLIFRFLVFIKNFLYDKNILKANVFDLKIISVGNISVGGTGKTPMVELLTKYYLSKGKKIAIISRGYKRKSSGLVVVSNGKNILVNEEISGDEPMQFAKKFPSAIVIVNKNRSEAIEVAKYQYNCDLVLLDDAFQHRKVKKDCEIVLLDGTKTLKDMNMIPAGESRENLSSFKRSNAIIITKCTSIKKKTDVIDKIRNFTNAPIFTTLEKIVSFYNVSKKRNNNLEFVKNKTAVVFCGIANPEYLISQLKELGISVLKLISFGDHHRFNDDDIKNILISISECNPKLLITTEKDFVRLPNKIAISLGEKISFLYANYLVSIKEEKSFFKMLDGYVKD